MIKRLFVSILLLTLAACSVPKHIYIDDSAEYLQRVGRFSVSSMGVDGQQQAVQGGFAWLDTGSQLTLDLSNPVGSTLARIIIVNGSASLHHSDGSVQYADNADALAKQALGSDVPVAGLRKWLRGAVNDLAMHKQYDNAGKISQFEEQGWHVSLSRYDDLGPTILRLNRNDAGTKISVRLAIK